MDKPIDNVPVCSPAESDPEDSQASRVSRKRARDSTKEQVQRFEEQFDMNDDGRPKTRRVNPARLAVRLGPELVAEMEALIVPGAKMPTFAVRKDFQERYCVDRRHIYDYFHSRGLRVSKEDKHTNLIRGRAMKAAAAAAAAAAVANPALSPADEAGSVNPGPCSTVQVAVPRPKPAVKAPKKRKLDSAKPRRTFLVPSTGSASRDSTRSPVSEPVPSLRSNSSMETDWNAHDTTSELSVSDGPGTPSTTTTPFNPSATTAKVENLDYLPFSPTESYLGPLLVGGHNGLLDSEYLSFCVDAETPSVDNSLGQNERTALYNLVQNSLHSGTTNVAPTGSYSHDSYIKDWTLFSNRMAAFSATGKDMVASPYALEYSPALSYGYSGELSPELFDLRSWLSEDLTREDAQGLHSSTSAGSSLSGIRTVYLGRYDGYPEPAAIFSREHIIAQARARTTSARGQI